MRIGIDARLYQEAGIGRYIRNLISELSKIDSENEYFILLLKKDYETLDLPKNFHKVLANFRWYSFSEQIKLPGILQKLKLDLVHFPHFNVPVFYQGKFIVTIHDLIHQEFAMKRSTTHNLFIFNLKQQAYHYAFSQALKKSQKIITVSDYVKSQLIKQGIKESKIIRTYEGVDESLVDLAKKITNSDVQSILKKLKVSQPYIFYVGNAHPHKNIERLILTFLNLRKRFQYFQLVLAGKDNYFWQRIKKEYSSSRLRSNNIVFVGGVSDQELVALYKGSKAYVFPSLSEGFGIPLLEAMVVGTPVTSSNKTSLPEVGGNAAIYFNPEDLKDMEEKIYEVITDEKLRKGLIEKGNKRVKDFSWKKLAKETLKVYLSN